MPDFSDLKLEIEVKVRLNDPAMFVRQMASLGFHLATPETFERNILYDTPDGSLRARGELLRLREYGGEWKLTHKADTRASGPHKVRIETETEVGDGAAVAEILERLGYRPAFIYEKHRTEWSDAHGHTVLDRTPIGNFVELEGEHNWIDATATKLGISPAQYLTASYAHLFLDWKAARNHPAKNMTFTEIPG